MVVQPGLVVPAGNFVRVAGMQVHDGNLLLSAIIAKRADPIQVLRSLFDPAIEIRPLRSQVPNGMPWSEYNALLSGMMRESQSVAAAVALRHLGIRVEARPVDETVGMSQRVTYHIDLPEEISFGSEEIGGTSAGLMLALEVYDQLTPGNLAEGMRIAGTGELRLDGSVAAVNGVRQKVVAAEAYGASLFLAPRENVAEASAAANSIKVVGVDTFEQAIRLLRRQVGEE